MKKFEGWLLCSDIDGTLLNSKGELSPENEQAIRYFQDNGGLFTLATGRDPSFLNRFEGQIQLNTYVILLNGNLLWDPRTETSVFQFQMEPEAVYAIARSALDCLPHYLRITFFTGENSATFITRETAPLNVILKQLKGPLLKVVFACECGEDAEKLQRFFRETYGGQYHFDLTWPLGLELFHQNGGKGPMVRKLKEFLPQITTTVCVGDFENDRSMLEEADIGYAPDNAMDLIKQIADRVTVSNGNHVIAAILKDLESEFLK